MRALASATQAILFTNHSSSTNNLIPPTSAVLHQLLCNIWCCRWERGREEEGVAQCCLRRDALAWVVPAEQSRAGAKTHATLRTEKCHGRHAAMLVYSKAKANLLSPWICVSNLWRRGMGEGNAGKKQPKSVRLLVQWENGCWSSH